MKPSRRVDAFALSICVPTNAIKSYRQATWQALLSSHDVVDCVQYDADYLFGMRPPRIMLLISCLSLTGCIPVRMQVGKHIDGTVVDKKTGVPIAGAEVLYRHKASTAVLTDTNGAFAIERQVVRYWARLLPVDYFGFRHYRLAMRADGYKQDA